MIFCPIVAVDGDDFALKALGHGDMSDDEFDDCFPVFTEDDLASIPHLNPIISTGDLVTPESNPSNDLSPFERHRPAGILSVTDLVSPAWCELQFDYGLRQRRSSKLRRRPESFVSSSGKEIFVDKAVAARNDQNLKRGKSVHKTLEEEVLGDEVLVHTKTYEEGWALRLLNMLNGIGILAGLGYTREMPVFGLVHDKIVVGFIDEIHRKPIERSLPPNHKKRPFASPETKSSKKANITNPIPDLTEDTDQSPQSRILSQVLFTTTPPAVQPPPYTLHLIDTKTRRSNSLPSDEDALSSRLQVMLYHRLLSQLLSSFDFAGFWARLGADSSRPFSPLFLSDTGLSSGSGNARVNCLDDLAAAWNHAVHSLQVLCVDPVLTLTYQIQTQPTKSRNSPSKTSDYLELLRGIEASLKESASAVNESPLCVDSESEGSLTLVGSEIGDPLEEDIETEDSDDDPQLSWALRESRLEYERGLRDHRNQETAGPSRDRLQPERSTSETIGSKSFEMNDEILDRHLADVLEWWSGVRPPRGVEIEHAGRCFTCEYCEGCEWREQKAMELSHRRKRPPTSS